MNRVDSVMMIASHESTHGGPIPNEVPSSFQSIKQLRLSKSEQLLDPKCRPKWIPAEGDFSLHQWETYFIFLFLLF
jgi:hypothetical protein